MQESVQRIPGIDSLLAAAIARGDVPGLVPLAATDSDILYEGAFGRRAVDQPQVMTTDGVFWTASMTKAVTSAAAMQLVECGRLALDAPIGNLLAQLASREMERGSRAPCTREPLAYVLSAASCATFPRRTGTHQ